ncbi:MAG: BlaI/MecI/CopY family transcriptional regulator [Oscillospiraceae bacterium]|nr:BlaI/MecI/CopY family transcriptional regulator [Oscillospiraceae bacterium]
MNHPTMGEVESRFADLIWSNEPISSGSLVKLCEAELKWKKSTTYTVLRRLCERGLFRNTDGYVTSLISREEYYAMQSEQFVEETFQGSLPGFLAAFTKRRRLSDKEIDALQELIDRHRG